MILQLMLLSAICSTDVVIPFQNQNQEQEVDEIWEKNGPMLRVEFFMRNMVEKHYPTIQFSLNYLKFEDKIVVKIMLVGSNRIVYHSYVILNSDLYDQKAMVVHQKKVSSLIADLLLRLS